MGYCLVRVIGNARNLRNRVRQYVPTPYFYFKCRTKELGGNKRNMKAPNSCPMCGEILKWERVDSAKKGFSIGKAAVGSLLLGPVGLLGGALGKKKVYYCCGKCGFEHEYDG